MSEIAYNLEENQVKKMKRSHTAYDKCIKVCTWRPNYWVGYRVSRRMSAYYSACFNDGSQRKM